MAEMTAFFEDVLALEIETWLGVMLMLIFQVSVEIMSVLVSLNFRSLFVIKHLRMVVEITQRSSVHLAKLVLTHRVVCCVLLRMVYIMLYDSLHVGKNLQGLFLDILLFPRLSIRHQQILK